MTYLLVLAGCFFGTLWLEYVMRTHVYRRWLRLILSIVPIAVVFTLWDLYAINSGHWSFDPDQITGLFLPGGFPLEELLFFMVIPACAILTLEAVRSGTGWEAGDEAPK